MNVNLIKAIKMNQIYFCLPSWNIEFHFVFVGVGGVGRLVRSEEIDLCS